MIARTMRQFGTTNTEQVPALAKHAGFTEIDPRIGAASRRGAAIQENP
jgi:hypothetical protein